MYALQAYMWAAERGYPEAQYMIAWMYRQGQYLPADPEKYREWLECAVGRHHSPAMNDLALLLYEEVNGVRAIGSYRICSGHMTAHTHEVYMRVTSVRRYMRM